MPMNPFKVVGLGTRKFQPDNEPVDKCNEHFDTGCGCCRINPCEICLEWEPDEGAIEYGTAYDAGSSWVGSAGGITFVAEWNQYNDCTMEIALNGDVVWSAKLCAEYGETAVTCRDWDGEIAYTKDAGDYGEQSGTFRWTRKDPRSLKRTLGGEYGNDSQCAEHFCGTCDCTCEQLCVTLSSLDTESCTGVIPFTGELCYGQDEARTAEWSGNVPCSPAGSVDVTVTLSRNAYGECELGGSISGTIDDSDIDDTFTPQVVTDCTSLAAAFTVSDGYNEYTIQINCLDCGECVPRVCLECCDSIPENGPPETLVARVTIASVNEIEGEPPIDTSCWTDLEFDISFLYDVDEDTTGACANFGSTRRVDCIGNLLDNEFDESCCQGGQWVGSGANACGTISICFIPCATEPCPPDPPDEKYIAWDAHMAVDGGNCDVMGQCLICGDTIAFSKEGYETCGGTLFAVGTGSVTLQVDISEA